MALQPFVGAALALKKVRRAGWSAKTGIIGAESVADHSFSMCALAMAVADLSGLDTLRAMKMVILHDLAESITGDLLPGQISKIEKRRRENAAMKKILAKLPARIRIEYREIWAEYVSDATKMARLVHRIDKLEMAMQARSYIEQGHPRAGLEEFFKSAYVAIGNEQDLVSLMLRSLGARC